QAPVVGPWQSALARNWKPGALSSRKPVSKWTEIHTPAAPGWGRNSKLNFGQPEMLGCAGFVQARVPKQGLVAAKARCELNSQRQAVLAESAGQGDRWVSSHVEDHCPWIPMASQAFVA